MSRVGNVTAASPSAQPLPQANPSDVGIPAMAVEGLLDELASRSLELHSLMVVRHGRVAAEGWWAPYTPERVHLLYSLSKSFTSSAVGFCVAEGRFALDDPVVDLLPDHTPADVDPAVASLTVHHLLSMSTGHRDDTLERAWTLEPTDVARGFLRTPPEEPVGSRHAYNNPTTYVLAAIVEKSSGMPLLDYLRPRLLDPLGIGAARWDVDVNGVAMGFTGLHLQTESVAAFGQLLLQNGRWGDEQVLPGGWVGLATRTHIDNDNDPLGPLDWGDGAHGQFCVVVPDHDLVVATTACVEDMQQVLDAVWERLLPALDQPDDGGYTAEPRLRERLSALAIPVIEPVDDGPGGEVTFTVADADAVGAAPLRPGSTVTVSPDQGDYVLTVALPMVLPKVAAPGMLRLSVPCGRERWAEGTLSRPETADQAALGGSGPSPTPVVCRGGWTAPDVFEADLVLVETPHRIRLRGSGTRMVASWNAPPLTGGRLESQVG